MSFWLPGTCQSYTYVPTYVPTYHIPIYLPVHHVLIQEQSIENRIHKKTWIQIQNKCKTCECAYPTEEKPVLFGDVFITKYIADTYCGKNGACPGFQFQSI